MPTKIEWTDSTWNPITGCSKISEGCENCYADKMSKRLAGRFGYPANDPFKPGTLHPDKYFAVNFGDKAKRVFVCSMGDIFHKDVSFEWVRHIWTTAAINPKHTFIFLTKRPARMRKFTKWLGKDWPSNCWLGVTAENQQRADERIPILLQIPAAVRFVSVEPMLGPLDISYWLNGAPEQYAPDRWQQTYPPLDWCIVGGETGPCARPMYKEWPGELRDQCTKAGVPFFFKGWGSWRKDLDYRKGRLLDNREWNEYPKEAKNEST